MRLFCFFWCFWGFTSGTFGEPPLYWAVANNDAGEVWKSLGDGGLPEGLDFDPVSWAVNRGSGEALDVLKWKGIRLDGVDDQGQNLLFGAAALGRVDLFRKILASGALPDQKDLVGRSLAHAAATSPHPEMVRLVLSLGTNPREKTTLGITPLMAAAGAGRADAVEILLDWGAIAEDEDFLGRSVRDYAVAGGDPRVLTLVDGALIPWSIGPAGGAPPP